MAAQEEPSGKDSKKGKGKGKTGKEQAPAKGKSSKGGKADAQKWERDSWWEDDAAWRGGSGGRRGGGYDDWWGAADWWDEPVYERRDKGKGKKSDDWWGSRDDPDAGRKGEGKGRAKGEEREGKGKGAKGKGKEATERDGDDQRQNVPMSTRPSRSDDTRRQMKEEEGVHCSVKKHSSIGCAVVSFRDPRVRQAILQKGAIAGQENGVDVVEIEIQGIKVKLKPHKDKETGAEVPSDLFVGWGRQVEKTTPLSEGDLAKFFDATHDQFYNSWRTERSQIAQILSAGKAKREEEQQRAAISQMHAMQGGGAQQQQQAAWIAQQQQAAYLAQQQRMMAYQQQMAMAQQQQAAAYYAAQQGGGANATAQQQYQQQLAAYYAQQRGQPGAG